MKPPKKIVIIGPESTGKSTLTQALAAHFSEPWVPEYARQYIENLQRPYQYEDLLAIAKGQLEIEDEMAKIANEMLFCDTELHVVKVWSEHKYDKTAPWILEQIEKRTYDLYLLTDIDIPWEEDPQREYPEPQMRQYFYNWFERLLMDTGTPIVNVSGDLQQRLTISIQAIQSIILKKS